MAVQRRRARLYTLIGRLATNLLVVAVLGAVAVLTWNVMSMDAVGLTRVGEVSCPRLSCPVSLGRDWTAPRKRVVG